MSCVLESNFELVSETGSVSSGGAAKPPSPLLTHLDHTVADETGTLVCHTHVEYTQTHTCTHTHSLTHSLTHLLTHSHTRGYPSAYSSQYLLPSHQMCHLLSSFIHCPLSVLETLRRCGCQCLKCESTKMYKSSSSLSLQ